MTHWTSLTTENKFREHKEIYIENTLIETQEEKMLKIKIEWNMRNAQHSLKHISGLPEREARNNGTRAMLKR